MLALIDSREKIPWSISLNEYITDISTQKIESGDYSLEGMEEIVAIERKKNVAELAHNITEDRFWRAISRLEEIRHPLIIIECPLDHFYRWPDIIGVPQSVKNNTRISPAFLLSSLNDIMSRRIPIIFAGDTYHAEKEANDFLIKIVKKYKR